MNHIMAENFMRSAKAPAMMAGVMMAKVAWYIRKTFSGTVLASSCTLPRKPAPKARDSPPITPLRSPPLVKASE
jgi:hypothetical protein